MLLNALFPLKLPDCNFVRVYRNGVKCSLKVTMKSTVFFVPELLIRAHDKRCRIRQVEIDYHPRMTGIATSGKPKLFICTLLDIARSWARGKLGVQ